MSVKKMSNFEIQNACNALISLQKLENELFEKTGRRLLQGKVRVCYAVNKNIEELKKALKPYVETLKALEEEYRDTVAEKTALEEANKNGEKSIDMIFRDDSKKDEFFEKRLELLKIESDVEIRDVDLDLLDGIELNSDELQTLMFMIRE